MTGLDPEEIKRVKNQPVKCTKCKPVFMVKPSEKVCPVCVSTLPKSLKRLHESISCARLNSNGV